jgi:hypothetical protein
MHQNAFRPIGTATRATRAARNAGDPYRRPRHATADSLPSSIAIPMPITSKVAPTNTAVIPVIENPAETVGPIR